MDLLRVCQKSAKQIEDVPAGTSMAKTEGWLEVIVRNF